MAPDTRAELASALSHVLGRQLAAATRMSTTSHRSVKPRSSVTRPARSRIVDRIVSFYIGISHEA
jgi:hypothetical protein